MTDEGRKQLQKDTAKAGWRVSMSFDPEINVSRAIFTGKFRRFSAVLSHSANARRTELFVSDDGATHLLFLYPAVINFNT